MSPENPQGPWGRDQRPPEIEELLEKLQEQFQKIFGLAKGPSSWMLVVLILAVWFFAGWGSFDVTLAVFSLESFYPAGCIDKFLLSRIERMAHRAYLCMDFICRAAGLKCIAATATNNYLFVFWMYIFFHIYDTPKYLNGT